MIVAIDYGAHSPSIMRKQSSPTNYQFGVKHVEFQISDFLVHHTRLNSNFHEHTHA